MIKWIKQFNTLKQSMDSLENKTLDLYNGYQVIKVSNKKK